MRNRNFSSKNLCFIEKVIDLVKRSPLLKDDFQKIYKRLFLEFIRIRIWKVNNLRLHYSESALWIMLLYVGFKISGVAGTNKDLFKPGWKSGNDWLRENCIWKSKRGFSKNKVILNSSIIVNSIIIVRYFRTSWKKKLLSVRNEKVKLCFLSK